MAPSQPQNSQIESAFQKLNETVDKFNDEQKKLFNELDRNGKRQLLKSLKGKKKYGFK